MDENSADLSEERGNEVESVSNDRDDEVDKGEKKAKESPQNNDDGKFHKQMEENDIKTSHDDEKVLSNTASGVSQEISINNQQPFKSLTEFTAGLFTLFARDMRENTNVFFASTPSTSSQPKVVTKEKESFAYDKVPGSSQNPPIEKFKQPEKVEKVTSTYVSQFPDRFLSGLKYGSDGLGMYGRGYYEQVTPMSHDTPKPEGHTRFVCISDTHGEHRNMEIPSGDVLLHCGDFTLKGKLPEVDDFNDWLGELPHKHKIVIAGNHELSFDVEKMEKLKEGKGMGLTYYRFGKSLKEIPEEIWRNWRQRLSNCTYLEDQEVRINGIRIFGSPWQPWFYGWAFNLQRGNESLEKWDKIPGDGIDILMTHGPPAGHMDRVNSYGDDHVGCVDLLNTVQLRVQPKYHLFGHIHESYGFSTDQFTIYANCCAVNQSYVLMNKAFVFDLPDINSEGLVGPI